MKCRVWVALAALLGVAALAFTGAAEKEGEKPGAKPAGPPPLVISKDAPLLLDAPATGPAATPRGPVADNEPCYCCHTNYREDSFVVYHARGDVGCVKCHGESLAHRNDEDNITPPDVMLAPDDIRKNCEKCHDSHDAPAAKVIAVWQEKCPARTNPNDLLCTDCHEHRLRFRSIWWDKKTGKLGVRAKGERIRMNPDLTKVPTATSAPPVQKPTTALDPGEEMR